MNLRFELDERVRCNAAARGAEGAAWLARLPRLVAELESAWGIKVGRIFPNATEAYVSEASKANGEQVVAHLLAGDPVTLGRQRCEMLANLTGVDPVPIWQWGFIERLVNGLLYLERGPAENAAEFLDVVDAWALTEPS